MKSFNKFGAFYLTILVVTIVVSQCPQSILSQSIDPEIRKRIDDFIQNVYLPQAQISGMGLTILQNNGEVLYATGYGMADKERGVRNENSTQFNIGSISKSFTAVVGAKLLNERFPDFGEAVLDTPIRKLLPQINFTLIDRFRSEQTTFRDLASHRMCLFPTDRHLYSESFNSAKELIYGTRYDEEICGFRTEYHYNDAMYVVVGGLIEVLANKSYEDVVQDLLNDLGMLNSTMANPTDDYTQMPFRAMPYYVMDNESYPMNTDLIKRIHLANAAGGLFISPTDMTKYMQLHLNSGNVDGRQIVPKEVMEWLSKPSSMMPGYSFKQSDADLIENTFGYGLGLLLSDYDGWQFVHHSGYFPPYRSQMSLYPAKNLGIFTSANMSPVLLNPRVLHAFIFEVLRGSDDSTAKQNAMRVKTQLEAKKVTNSQKSAIEFQSLRNKLAKQSIEHGVADIVGKYGSGSAGELEVLEKFNEDSNKTEYYFQYGKWYTGWLEPIETNLFKLNLDTDAIQDDYSAGFRVGPSYVAFVGDTLYLLTGDEGALAGTFKLGVRSDLLPPIPWSPDSCGRMSTDMLSKLAVKNKLFC